MGVNITLPPRRRRTSIPAIAGRELATPWAWGRISVTVDLAITRVDKATPVPAALAEENQWVVLMPADSYSGEVTPSVS